jgi:G3E family GTPase
MWLGALLYQRSEDIYRMKGILSVQDMDERFVFQVTNLCHYFDHFG